MKTFSWLKNLGNKFLSWLSSFYGDNQKVLPPPKKVSDLQFKRIMEGGPYRTPSCPPSGETRVKADFGKRMSALADKARQEKERQDEEDRRRIEAAIAPLVEKWLTRHIENLAKKGKHSCSLARVEDRVWEYLLNTGDPRLRMERNFSTSLVCKVIKKLCKNLGLNVALYRKNLEDEIVW